MSTTENIDVNNKEGYHLEDAWAIRPCFLYKEEYDDCTSIKARFHQYFIHGKNIDCSQWNKDYKNCLKYEKDQIQHIDAGREIIKSEEERRKQRLHAHYSNNIWKKRIRPPDDWNKPLPEWLLEKNKNTFLELKAKELNKLNNDGGSNANQIGASSSDKNSFCSIM